MSDPVAEALRAAAREAGRPLANMYGGCFKPEERSQRGDCADGDCYCTRVQRHTAATAIAAFLRALHAAEVKARPFGNGTFRLDDLAAAVERAAREGRDG